MQSSTVRHLLLAAATGLAAAAATAQSVTPPPRPPGSELVRPEAGMSEPERKRHVRAHHHKFHHKKDYTRDDSVHGPASEAAARTGVVPTLGGGTPLANYPGGAGSVPGGPGTGPQREKTDRGASSWFFGQPDNKTKK